MIACTRPTNFEMTLILIEGVDASFVHRERSNAGIPKRKLFGNLHQAGGSLAKPYGDHDMFARWVVPRCAIAVACCPIRDTQCSTPSPLPSKRTQPSCKLPALRENEATIRPPSSASMPKQCFKSYRP